MAAVPPRRKLVREDPKGGRHLVETSSYKPILSICDYIGLSQHEGECWVDTIQQIFFFTDGLKELTQPLFYNLTDAKLHEYMHKAVAAGIFLDDILTPKESNAAAPVVANATLPAAPVPPIVSSPGPSDPPIIAAAKTNDLATMKSIVEAGTSIETVNTMGNTSLIYASLNGNKPMVEFLLEKGAIINRISKTGSTALIAAAMNGHYEIVDLLLNNGALIDLVDKEGSPTALLSAALRRHESIVTLLVNNGANIDATEKDGNTALILASELGLNSTVQTLLKLGAKINETNKNKMTALILATYNNHESVIKTLLENGADVNIKNSNGDTALMIAVKNNKTIIIELLYTKMQSSNFPPIKPVVEEPIQTKALLSIYEEGIKAMRDRFKNHYNVIVHKDEATCLVDGPQKIRQMYLASVAGPTLFKRLESKRLGVAVAKGTQDKNAQQARLNSGGKYNSGGSLMQELAISNLLYRVFNLPFRAMWLVTGLASKAPIHALGIDMLHIDGTKLIGGHATGFLKCKEQWYYYNDNTGLFAVSTNLVTALQTALNFNDGKQHPSISIKTVKERCYLLKLNNVKTVYKYETYGFDHYPNIIGDVTPAMIWTETDWIDYTTWKISHAEEATEIETMKMKMDTGSAYYNILTCAYCVVKYELDQASTIFNNAIRIDDNECFKSIMDDVEYDPLDILKKMILNENDNNNIIETILLKHPDIDLNEITKPGGKTIFKELLENNNYILTHSSINPNFQDIDGMTILMYAMKNGMNDEDISKILANKMIDINIQDKNGMTALMYAVTSRHTNMIKRILEKHPNLNLTTKGNMFGYGKKTALDLAKESAYNDEIIKLIEDAMKAPPAGGRRRMRTRKGRRSARKQTRRRR